MFSISFVPKIYLSSFTLLSLLFFSFFFFFFSSFAHTLFLSLLIFSFFSLFLLFFFSPFFLFFFVSFFLLFSPFFTAFSFAYPFKLSSKSFFPTLSFIFLYIFSLLLLLLPLSLSLYLSLSALSPLSLLFLYTFFFSFTLLVTFPFFLSLFFIRSFLLPSFSSLTLSSSISHSLLFPTLFISFSLSQHFYSFVSIFCFALFIFYIFFFLAFSFSSCPTCPLPPSCLSHHPQSLVVYVRPFLILPSPPPFPLLLFYCSLSLPPASRATAHSLFILLPLSLLPHSFMHLFIYRYI